MGMKLEAIREDRTRGGRSTYQCSYTIPAGLSGHASLPPGIPECRAEKERLPKPPDIPSLLQVRKFTDTDLSKYVIQEIMNVEHLWFSNKMGPPSDTKLDEKGILTKSDGSGSPAIGCVSSSQASPGQVGEATGSDKGEDIVQTLTRMADQRLYKLVKWCKSLPLFKNILVSVARNFSHNAFISD